MGSPESFDGEVTIHHGDDHRAFVAGNGTIDDEKVAVMDSGALHGPSARAEKEGRRRVCDQFFVEIERPLDMVVGRGGESRLDPGGQERSCGGEGLCCWAGSFFHGKKTLTKDEHKASGSVSRGFSMP